MARTIPADRLARVGSHDMLGSVAATPLGALLAGPLAATIGIRPAQFAVTLPALAPKEIRAEAGRAAANR